MSGPPDFLVIGAMKCATTTLHEQLARQPGIFMSRLKEPNYFSDDEVYAHGRAWYDSLFAEAPPGALRGESSTHYTKLPLYPHAVARMARDCPVLKCVYVMRHPIDRLLSQYRHARNVGQIEEPLEEAVETRIELVAYSLYATQLLPYLETYGSSNVLPVFFERLVKEEQAELERIGRFLGLEGAMRWDPTLKAQNVGNERLKRNRFREALLHDPVLTAVRRRVVPRALSDAIKERLRDKAAPPEITPELEARLASVFDQDLARLGGWLGAGLSCANFKDAVTPGPLDWTHAP